MKIPKTIDFSNIKERKIFEPSSKEYKALLKLDDEGEWKDYINEMVVSGVSVIYDASGDFFVVKPVAFKENNNKMSKGNKLKLDDFSFLFENDKEKKGRIKKGSKQLKEDNFEKKYLLHDDDEEDQTEDNLDIETPVNNLIHLDDEDVDLATPETANALPPAEVSNQPSSNLTVQDIENIVKQLLSGQTTATDKPSGVPDSLASGEASTVNQNVDCNIDVLESEFPENHSKINVIENKIENNESYLDILNGDIFGEGEEIEDEITELPVQVGVGTNIPSDANGNVSDGISEFDIYEPEEEDEEHLIQESPNDEFDIIEPSDYEDGDLDLTEPEVEPEIVPTNSTFTAAGQPIRIEITGWLITKPEVTQLAEAVKKNKAKLRKLQSNNDKELFLVIECNNKFYKLRYEDRSKVEVSRPWSIKDKKFATINEALSLVRSKQLVNNKEKAFRDLIANDKDLSSRTLSNLKESNIFEDFRNDKNSINYVAGWNVKPVGSLDLKKGLNEVFSNITEHNPKSKNTLFKTKEGKYYLLKGNLGEASQKGEKRQLVDLEGKKEFGVGQVIGLYENTEKGLGQIMYKIQRTSIPLLVWKRK